MSNEWIITFLVIAFIFYSLWRRYDAIVARGRIADGVDKYLGEDHPEELKMFVYHAFDRSLNPLIASLSFFRFMFQLGKNSPQLLKELRKEHGDKEFQQAFVHVKRAVVVNILLTPVSYLFMLLLIVIISFVKVLLNKAVTFKYYNSAKVVVDEVLINH